MRELRSLGGVTGSSQNPRQQLPIASHPSMLATGRHLVARRELLEEIDVRHESGPGEESLEEVKKIEGVAGVHVMAIEWEAKVHEIVERAGLLPRPQVD